MKKVIFTLVVTICVVFLCNVKVGFTQGMEQRMDYLETRISEITTIQGDYTGDDGRARKRYTFFKGSYG